MPNAPQTQGCHVGPQSHFSPQLPGGLYSTYFLVRKKGGGLHPVLKLKGLYSSLRVLSFHRLSKANVLRAVSRGDRFTSVTLKDVQVPIVPKHHRRFLHLAYQGHYFWFRVLPFGLSLYPQVFTGCVAAALSPPVITGRENTAVPGRLANLCAIPATGCTEHCSPSLLGGPVGSQGEYREELYEPFSEHNLHRCSSGCSHYEGPFVAPACGRHPPQPSPLPRGLAVALHPLSLPIGQSDSGLSCRSFGLAVVAPLFRSG